MARTLSKDLINLYIKMDREEWLKRKEKYLKKYAKEWLESNRIDAIHKG